MRNSLQPYQGQERGIEHFYGSPDHMFNNQLSFDEYVQVDVQVGDPIKVMVKRATLTCNAMNKENAEYRDLILQGGELLDVQTDEVQRKILIYILSHCSLITFRLDLDQGKIKATSNEDN